MLLGVKVSSWGRLELYRLLAKPHQLHICHPESLPSFHASLTTRRQNCTGSATLGVKHAAGGFGVHVRSLQKVLWKGCYLISASFALLVVKANCQTGWLPSVWKISATSKNVFILGLFTLQSASRELLIRLAWALWLWISNGFHPLGRLWLTSRPYKVVRTCVISLLGRVPAGGVLFPVSHLDGYLVSRNRISGMRNRKRLGQTGAGVFREPRVVPEPCRVVSQCSQIHVYISPSLTAAASTLSTFWH